MARLPITPAQAAREIIERERAAESLYHFICYVFPKFIDGGHIREICQALDDVIDGKIKNLILEAPPRHGKSNIVSRYLPAYYLGRHPDREIITASYNQKLASIFGRHVRNLLRSREFQNVFPDVTLSADSQSKSLWHTNSDGVYMATGVDGGQSGFGAHLFVMDDLLKGMEEAQSATIKEAIYDWYLAEVVTREMPISGKVLMATRWAEDDLIGRVLADDPTDWVRLKFPGIKHEGTKKEEALWPERYPLARMRKTRTTMKRAGRSRIWSALYQQEPTPEEGDYIKRGWFKVRYREVPERLRVYLWSDFAVTQAKDGRDPDWTEHGVFGVDTDDNVVPIDWWSGRTTADEWIEAWIDLMDKHKPACVFAESGVIRRAIEPMLIKRMRERRVYARIEWIPSVKDKATRGRAFQARAHMGKVLFGRQPWADDVIEQCTAFPGGKHDDKFDVMSGMCGVLDQAHPATLGSAKNKKRPDPYAEPDTKPSNWKVA